MCNGAAVVVIWPSSDPPTVAKEVAAQVETWDGIEYRGEIADPNGGQMEMVVVVDRDGNAGGTLRQGTGGRAEFRTVGAASYLKGDRAWWQRAEPRYVDEPARIGLLRSVVSEQVRTAQRRLISGTRCQLSAVDRSGATAG